MAFLLHGRAETVLFCPLKEVMRLRKDIRLSHDVSSM